MDSQTFKPDLRRLLATQLHKPLSTWSHQCTLETHSETFTHSCMLRTLTESPPDTSTHSETFTHSSMRNYIHTFRHLHTSSCRQHPHVQGQTQRHTLAHSSALTETQKGTHSGPGILWHTERYLCTVHGGTPRHPQ